MEIRPDISDLMSRCIGCGRCTDVCISHAYGGCDPFEVMQGNLEMAKGCLGCGMCNRACEYTVPKKVVMYAACMVNGMELSKAYRETGYNLPPGDTAGMPLPSYTKSADAVLMPGCLVVSAAPYVEYSAERVLSAMGVPTERFEGGCCTYPVPFRGLDDSERDAIKKKACAPLKGRKLYAICSGCTDEMASSGIDAEHIIHIIRDKIGSMRLQPLGLRIAVQTGCGLRECLSEFEDVVRACGCEIYDAEQGCCGKLVPRISQELMQERQDSMKGADAVVVGCPSCYARYDQCPGGIPVLYVTELVLMALGDRSTLPFHRRPISR